MRRGRREQTIPIRSNFSSARFRRRRAGKRGSRSKPLLTDAKTRAVQYDLSCPRQPTKEFIDDEQPRHHTGTGRLRPRTCQKQQGQK